MIKRDLKPYDEILRRTQADSGQYTTGRELMDRCANRIWCFHTYHVAELDSEGYMPQIIHDDNWSDIWCWLHTREGIEWLLTAPDEWPNYFRQYITFLALKL